MPLGSALATTENPATIVLRSLMSELAPLHEPSALSIAGQAAGRRAARQLPPRPDLTMGEFLVFAQETISSLGFGDIELIWAGSSILLCHEGRGGEIWLGDYTTVWLPHFVHALYQDWLRQIGLPPNLTITLAPPPSEDSTCVIVRIDRELPAADQGH